MPYDRISAVSYAQNWALKRNPIYYDFNNLGGDCTNFASQCVYAGSKIMNYTKNLGWYYNSLNDRAPAWTGVDFFMNFLTTNVGIGPFGNVIPIFSVEPGDIVFLENSLGNFYHTVVVSKIEQSNVYICCHTYDARDKSLFEYNFARLKAIHILGVRK